MKLKKLTAALMMAGVAGGAFGAAHVPDETQTFTLGEAPNLYPNEEALIVLYESMMSMIGAMVAADSCISLQNRGPISFDADVPSVPQVGNPGVLRFGNFQPDRVTMQASLRPEENGRPADKYGRKYNLAMTDDGVLYYEHFKISNFQLTNGQGGPLYPAFSAGSAIYHTAAQFDIAFVLGGNLSDPSSRWDEHIIKDFYRLEPPKENNPSCSTIGGSDCDDPRIFYDWGLEVITKYDYPFYKYRQDSSHTPWNGTVGNWTVRKELITPNAASSNTTYCILVATGDYFASGGDISWEGDVTVTAPGIVP